MSALGIFKRISENLDNMIETDLGKGETASAILIYTQKPDNVLLVKKPYKRELMRCYYFSILILFILTGCKSGSEPTQAQAKKAKAVEKTLNHNDFEIHFDKAFPQGTIAFQQAYYSLHLLSPGSSANAIDLSGITSYIKVKGDTISGKLPFYGERYFGGGYGANANIRFNAVPKSFHRKTKEKLTEIKFTIADKKHAIESYQVFLKIFRHGRAYLSLTSTQRSTISYSGILSIKNRMK